jgi:hypothetical protein
MWLAQRQEPRRQLHVHSGSWLNKVYLLNPFQWGQPSIRPSSKAGQGGSPHLLLERGRHLLEHRLEEEHRPPRRLLVDLPHHQRNKNKGGKGW